MKAKKDPKIFLKHILESIGESEYWFGVESCQKRYSKTQKTNFRIVRKILGLTLKKASTAEHLLC